MDPQKSERALRSALDEVEQAHAIIEQQKDRDTMRERIKWLSDRVLYYSLASTSKDVLLTEDDYGALLDRRTDDQTPWASLCAATGAKPAGGITLEQFCGLRSDPHGDLQALADQPVIRRAARTASEATPGSALPGLTAEKRVQLEQNVDGVLKEILQTERDYVEAMREVVEDFYRPLLDSSFSVEGAILDSEDVHKIFGNVEDILLISEELLHGLHTRIEIEGQRKVSDIFLNMGFAFKLYSRYISRYEKASVALRNASQNNEQFCQWLIESVSFVEACGADPNLVHRTTFVSSTDVNGATNLEGNESRSQVLDTASSSNDVVFDDSPRPEIPEIPTLSLDICLQKLSNQLMKPVQRVIRYQMLVEELHKNTAKLGLPTKDLELCLARLRGINDFNNEEIRVSESKEKLQKLQTRLGGRVRLVGSQKIVKFQHHVREQELIKVHGKGDRRTARCHLALLTDEILYSRPEESKTVGRRHAELNLRARIPIEPATTRFEDIADDDHSGFANRIAIISAKRTFVVYCPGPNGKMDKRDWLEDLRRTQQAARKKTGQADEAYQHVGVSIPVYQPDGPKCSICNHRFGVMRRRHHCRLCGACVCDTCASNFVDLRKLNRPYDMDQAWGADERVCDDCIKWANIFYQDYLHFLPASPKETKKAGRMWITPVVQKLQETRLNQLADRASKRSEAVEHIGPNMLSDETTQQEVLDEETRQARASAAWRFAMRSAVEHGFHQYGSQKDGLSANLLGLWSGWLWKLGSGTDMFGRQTWKKRWFVLTKEQLSYYENIEQLMKSSRPGHSHHNTAKGTLRLRDYTISSIDRVGLQCILASHCGGRDLHIAQFNPEDDEMVSTITTRNREDFLMLVAVLQSLVEVVVDANTPDETNRWQHRTNRDALALRRKKENEKKAQAFQQAEYYAQKAHAAHADLQAVQEQIQQHAEDTAATATGEGETELQDSRTSSENVKASSEHERVAFVPPPVPRHLHLNNHRNTPLPDIPSWVAKDSPTPPPLPRRPPAVPSVPPHITASPIADCPASLEAFEVVFGLETAKHLGINCGLRLGGGPDLQQYSCCLEYFVRMQDGSDGPAKKCGKVR